MPRNLLIYFKIFIITCLIACLAPDVKGEISGTWCNHPGMQVATYVGNHHTVKIIPSPKRTYFLIYAQMYSKDLNGPFPGPYLNLFFHDNNAEVSNRNLLPVSSLSDQLTGGILNCNYSPEGEYLFGVLDNGNCFRIDDDGTTTLFPPLYSGIMPGALKINDISFAPKDNRIWIATTSGIVALDDRSGNKICNISSTENVNSVAQVGETLFASLQRNGESLLMSSEIGDAFPMTVDKFEGVKIETASRPGGLVAADGETVLCTSDILPLSDNTIAFIGPMSGKTGRTLNLLSLNKSTGVWTPLSLASAEVTLTPDNTSFFHPFEGNVAGLKDSYSVHLKDYYSFNKGVDPDLSLTPTEAVAKFKKDAGWRTVTVETDFRGCNLQAAVGAPYNSNNFWFYLPQKGFVKRTAAQSSGSSISNWSYSSATIIPNAPEVHHASYMTWHPDYGVLVRSRSVDNLFGFNTAPIYDHLSAYRNGEWKQIGLADINYNNRMQHYNAIGILVDSDNPEYIYSASYRSGLMRLNPGDASDLLLMTCGDQFSANNNTKVKISPDVDNIKSSQKAWACFSNILPDAHGNLWTSWFSFVDDAPTALYFMFWPRDNRLATKNAASFKPWTTLRIDAGIEKSNKQFLVPLTFPGNENLLIYSSAAYNAPIMVYNHGGTPDNIADDRYSIIRDPYDKEGRQIDYDYISGFFEDPYDGRVWFMTQSGIFWFDPHKAFIDSRLLNRLEINDVAEYNGKTVILENGGVLSMTADSQGRKWIGSQNGGIYCISPDSSTLLAHLHTDNSDLVDNTILSLTWNPDNSSLMVGTLKGIQEFIPDDGRQEDTKNIAAVPSVIEPEYMGYLTITSLQDNASYEAHNLTTGEHFTLPQPESGMIHWDLLGTDGNRIPPGKYTITRRNSTSPLTHFLLL